MNENEITKVLQKHVSDGLVEVAEENDAPGQTRYKLTGYGLVEAQQTIATKGLPFLLKVMSVQAVRDGKNRTVKSMADEAIKDLPGKLKRLARVNFALFWNELASYTPEQYLEGYVEAEDAAT